MPLRGPFGAGVPSDFGLAGRPGDTKIYPSWVNQALSAGADVILKLDDSGSGAGAFVDASGNGHHLTPNTTIVNGSNMLGANQALADSVFDYSTGLGQATSAYDVTQAQMSMGVRVKPLSLTASGSQLYTIVMSCATAGNTRGWDIGYRTNGTWTLIFAGVAVYEFGGAPLATVGVSTSFMVVLRSGNRADLYLDGVFKLRVTTGSMLLGSGTTLTINSYPTNGGNYQGKFELEAAEIYRYSLTNDQAFQSHNAGVQPLPDSGSPAVFPIECDATQAQAADMSRTIARISAVTQAQSAVQIRSAGRVSSTTQPQAAVSTRTAARVVSTTQAQSAAQFRSAGRVASTTQPQAAALVRVVNRVTSATQVQVAAQIRSVGRASSSTQAQAAAARRTVNRSSATTQAQVAVCVKTKATLIIIAATQPQSATTLRSVARRPAATQAQVAISARLTARSLPATQSQAAASMRIVLRSATASQTQVADVSFSGSVTSTKGYATASDTLQFAAAASDDSLGEATSSSALTYSATASDA